MEERQIAHSISQALNNWWGTLYYLNKVELYNNMIEIISKIYWALLGHKYLTNHQSLPSHSWYLFQDLLPLRPGWTGLGSGVEWAHSLNCWVQAMRWWPWLELNPDLQPVLGISSNWREKVCESFIPNNLPSETSLTGTTQTWVVDHWIKPPTDKEAAWELALTVHTPLIIWLRKMVNG